MVEAEAKTDVELRSLETAAFLELLGSNPTVRVAFHDFMIDITRRRVRDSSGDVALRCLRAIAAAMRQASA